jgi:hypothetical protein
MQECVTHSPVGELNSTDQPRLLTQSQEAACRYVVNNGGDALDHLRAICWKATRPLFIPNEFPASKFVRKLHKVDDDGGVYSIVKTEYESSSSETHDFIDIFVRQDLAPFVGKFIDDESLKWFQHIGRRCRLALVNRLRESGKLTDGGTIVCRVSADHGYQEDDGGKGDNLGDYIVAARNNNPIRPEDWLGGQKADLDLLDPLLYTGFKAFFDAYTASETMIGAKGDATLRLSESLGISIRQARTYKNRFLNLVRGKYRDSTIIRDAYDVILTFSRRSGATECVLPESPASKAKRQLLSEAGKDMAEFLAWTGQSSAVKKAVREADYMNAEQFDDRQLTPAEANYARAINYGESPSEVLADSEAAKFIASEAVCDASDLDCYEDG